MNDFVVKRVAVVGATGILGRQVVARLLERGHEVAALVRPGGRPLPIEAPRLSVIEGDIFDRAALSRTAAGADAMLHLATAIPAPGGAMDWTANDRVRRDGTETLTTVAASCGIARIVAQGIAMVVQGAGEAWLDEASPCAGNPVTQSALDMEQLIAGSGRGWTVLRGGLFYGPGTSNSADWAASAEAGTLQAPGDGSDRVSLIHVTDMARAVVAATEAPQAHGILNIVDDAPPTWSELLSAVGRRFGQDAVQTGAPRRFPSFRVSNARACAGLGWEPVYPTYLSGLLA